MSTPMNRIEREKRTVRLMIGIYCRRMHHGSGEALCPSCRELSDYACERLERCPKGDAKTSCRKCDIHCYAPSRRDSIREVMRTVGPGMIFSHPLAAIRHLISELK